MKKVLDSSAALPTVLPEKETPKAIQLQRDYHNGLVELIAPDIFPAEVYAALTKAERMKRIKDGEARVLYDSVIADCPVLIDYLPLIDRAGEISSKHRVALYDCLYLALSEQESCDMVTNDMKFVNALQKDFPQIVHLSNL